MLHAVLGGKFEALELMDDPDVVARAGAFDRPEQLARPHVAVVGDVAGHRDRAVAIGGLPFAHELRHARKVQLVYQVVPNTPNRLSGAPQMSGQSCWLEIQAGFTSSFAFTT